MAAVSLAMLELIVMWRRWKDWAIPALDGDLLRLTYVFGDDNTRDSTVELWAVRSVRRASALLDSTAIVWFFGSAQARIELPCGQEAVIAGDGVLALETALAEAETREPPYR